MTVSYLKVESSWCLLNVPKLESMSLIDCLLLNILRVTGFRVNSDLGYICDMMGGFSDV